MSLTAGDIREIHASFGQPDELVRRRRAIYRLALEFAGARIVDGTFSAEPVAPDVLDNPAVRAHLGGVLGGTVAFNAHLVSSLSQLVSSHGEGRISEGVHRLASTPEATVALAGALERVDAELARSGVDVESAKLVLPMSPPFQPAMRTLLDGIELALDVAPELTSDLLPHVALFAIIDSGSTGRLGSASVREFPGLILMPAPTAAVEAAEALVHEGAHQKFFDLAVTNSILGVGQGEAFTAPWAADGTPAWPFEQCLAAFHAYSCLSAFANELRGREVFLHSYSLLPVAAERAMQLGDWLLPRTGLLGRDGRAFVAALCGRPTGVPSGSKDLQDELSANVLSDDSVAMQRCGEWTLVMQWGPPANIFWVPSLRVSDL